jgi:hypothetical protein
MAGEKTRYEELVRLEPRLAELEQSCDAVRDPGGPRFFCSNHAWLPLASDLRALVGVYRRGWSSRRQGDPLYDGRAFEACYLHLSARLPACRGCGCRAFQPWRERQLAELGRRR